MKLNLRMITWKDDVGLEEHGAIEPSIGLGSKSKEDLYPTSHYEPQRWQICRTPIPLQCASFSTEMAAWMTVLGTQTLSLSQSQCSTLEQFNTSRVPSWEEGEGGNLSEEDLVNLRFEPQSTDKEDIERNTAITTDKTGNWMLIVSSWRANNDHGLSLDYGP